MKRREFIQKTSAATALASMPGLPILSNGFKGKKITILHTNDQHSRIEAFEKSDNDRYSERGGFARRASLIQQIRKQEENILLLDSGDIFQGTPYFNYFGGELEFKLMSQMGYDFATIGNHDFDAGMDGLKKQLPHAKFEFINANYDFTNTILEGEFKPYKIIVKNGIKIGLFGLGIELQGLVSKELYKETVYNDPLEVANQISQELKDKDCDLVICLSHLGFKYRDSPDKVCDIILGEKTKNIDLILGGHTHTFLEEPVIVQNLAGESVYINQVGWAGLMLGRIDIQFDLNKKNKTFAWNNLSIKKGNTLA